MSWYRHVNKFPLNYIRCIEHSDRNLMTHEEKCSNSQRLKLKSKTFSILGKFELKRSIFADENEIPYWIADETLLGWHWGQKRLNWDTSIKVHLSFKLLYELQKYSGSIINDKYKFEINPNLERREYQVNNEIDATFTDIRTGYFVDIKGLGTRHLHVVHVHTKTPDFYRHKSIFPLVRTLFEGIPTWRPSNYSEILESKYGSSALTAKIFDVTNGNIEIQV